MFELLTDLHVAWFQELVERVRGRPSAAEGWEAVATDGDDTLEMSQTHRRTDR